MPLTWVEDNESRSATIVRLGRKAQSTYVKSWKIFGETDDLVVHNDVNTTVWNQYLYWEYPGQPNNRLHADHYTLDYLGDDAWSLKVTYVKDGAEDSDQQQPLKRARSFDTSGGTAHKTQAESETGYGSNAPSMSGAIGVDGDSVAGVDIVIPSFQWTENYDVPASYVSSSYITGLASLTGTVNNATFRGFPAGEVLFVGASGSQEWDSDKGDGPWSLSFKFIQSPNAGAGQTLAALTIGSITGIAKKGHDYLWVRYEDDVSDNTLIKKPRHVYVNKVYRDGNFSGLGIGVS